MSKKKSEQRSLSRRISGVTMPIKRKRMRWCRNWPCLCASGKKYKKCCLDEIESFTALDSNASVTELPEDIKKMIDTHKNGDMKKNG